MSLIILHTTILRNSYLQSCLKKFAPKMVADALMVANLHKARISFLSLGRLCDRIREELQCRETGQG